MRRLTLFACIHACKETWGKKLAIRRIIFQSVSRPDENRAGAASFTSDERFLRQASVAGLSSQRGMPVLYINSPGQERPHSVMAKPLALQSESPVFDPSLLPPVVLVLPRP